MYLVNYYSQIFTHPCFYYMYVTLFSVEPKYIGSYW